MTTFKPPTCKHGCTDECIECIEEKAFAAGKREAAQHILDMWYAPWGVTQMSFIDSLKAYVEALK